MLFSAEMLGNTNQDVKINTQVGIILSMCKINYTHRPQ